MIKKFETVKPYINYFFCAIWIVVCICLARYAYCHSLIGFETNDDFYIELILNGSFGNNYPYTVYTNVLLGFFLVPLYKLMPFHNWFLILQLFAGILFPYIALGVWNIRKKGTIKGFLLSATVLFATFDSLVCRLNYSKTGAFLLAVGVLFLFSSLENEEWLRWQSRFERILSYLMILLGGLMRKQLVLAFIPFAIIMCIYFYKKQKNSGIMKFLPLIAVAVSLSLVWAVDYGVYSTNEEWKAFKAYDKTRIELLDYDLPDYYDFEEVYSSMGLSINDYSMLKDWRIGDKEVFTEDIIKNIVTSRNEVNRKNRDFDYFQNISFNLIEFTKSYGITIVLILVFFLSIYSGINNFFFPTFLLLTGFGELFGLLINGRLNERSLYVPIIMALIMVLFFVDKEDRKSPSKVEVSLLLLLIAFFAFYGCGFYSMTNRIEIKGKNINETEELFSYTEEHKDCLFIIDIVTDATIMMPAYDILKPLLIVDHSNVSYTGGWLVPSPVWGDINGKYGERYSVFKSLAENDNVFLILPQEADCASVYYFICEHFYPGLRVEVVDTVGNYNILSFTE